MVSETNDYRVFFTAAVDGSGYLSSEEGRFMPISEVRGLPCLKGRVVQKIDDHLGEGERLFTWRVSGVAAHLEAPDGILRVDPSKVGAIGQIEGVERLERIL